MAHRLAARILTTEKDSEMNQTTNINISYDHKNDMQNHQNVTLPPSESGNVSPRVEARDIELTEDIPDTGQEIEWVEARDIELTEDIPDTGQEIEFLETLLQEYQSKPVVVKGLLICKSKNLMNLIKLATQADKVEIACTRFSGALCFTFLKQGAFAFGEKERRTAHATDTGTQQPWIVLVLVPALARGPSARVPAHCTNCLTEILPDAQAHARDNEKAVPFWGTRLFHLWQLLVWQ